jgi:arylamine N-acetyltransferase
MHKHIPFQSMSLLLLPRAFRRLPSHSQIKRDVYARVGGCCYVLNVFVRELIRALGQWETYYVRCAIHNVEDCHISVVVSSVLQPGDLYMIDVGCGYVLPQPVCLSFDGDESPVYEHGFLRVKFVRRDPSVPAEVVPASSDSAGRVGGVQSDGNYSNVLLWRLHARSSTFEDNECTLQRPDSFDHIFWRMSLARRPLHDAGETQQVPYNPALIQCALTLFIWLDYYYYFFLFFLYFFICAQTRAFTSYRKLRASTASGTACRMTYIKADVMINTSSITGTSDGRDGSDGIVLRARVLRDIDGALVCESVTDVEALVSLLHAHFPAFELEDVARAVHQLMSPDEHS